MWYGSILEDGTQLYSKVKPPFPAQFVAPTRKELFVMLTKESVRRARLARSQVKEK